MTRELITRASYLNTNFNQVIYKQRAAQWNAFGERFSLMEVKSYKNQQDGKKRRRRFFFESGARFSGSLYGPSQLQSIS